MTECSCICVIGTPERIIRPVPTPRLKLPDQYDLSAGKYLKDMRQHLGMALREVQEASEVLAKQENNEDLYISAARLDQIENEASAPGNHKLLSLSAIYGVDYLELLSKYGVRPDSVHHYRRMLQQKRTHPVSRDLCNVETTLTLPMKLDPRFRWEATQFVNRMVAVWGEIPASLLTNFNPRQHILGFVGLEDNTMYPLLRPGAFVLVDGEKRKVIDGEWANEHERPIYFIELRVGYRCAWCQITDGMLTLVPHPLSGVRVETFNFPDDAEIVGQVVGIAMRLVPSEPSSEQ